jgi:hypothetical protein
LIDSLLMDLWERSLSWRSNFSVGKRLLDEWWSFPSQVMQKMDLGDNICRYSQDMGVQHFLFWTRQTHPHLSASGLCLGVPARQNMSIRAFTLSIIPVLFPVKSSKKYPLPMVISFGSQGTRTTWLIGSRGSQVDWEDSLFRRPSVSPNYHWSLNDDL